MEGTPSSVPWYLLLCSLAVLPWAFLMQAWGKDLASPSSDVLAYTVIFLSSLHILGGCVFQPLMDWGQHNEPIQRMTRGLMAMAAGAGMFHVFAVLFGAPLKESFINTFLWASLMSCTCVLPTAMIIGTDINQWRELFLYSSTWYSLSEIVSYWGAVAGVVGAWIGAIPIPLDWDRPWQVWPIPCIYGAIMGHMVGTIGASFFYWYSPNKINKMVG